jgi:predicted NBD/HSP70 family sugar kinase
MDLTLLIIAHFCYNRKTLFMSKHTQHFTMGVDIGGTKIQAGLVSAKNKIIVSQRFPMDQRNKKAAIDSIITAIQALMSPGIRAIGIGITGHVDAISGVVHHSANLPKDWRNVPLKKILEKKFKKPVTIDNDGHCIALAEATHGAGKNHPIVLGMTIGTGIGCGLVINKKVYHGANNIIEIGHTIISDKHALCHCGGYGHFEALVSGPAMERRYFELTGQHKKARAIEDEAKDNKKAAKSVFHEMSDYLARGLANTLNSYNPDIIILGGGLGKVPLLVQPAIRQIQKYIFYSSLLKAKIVASHLKYDAGILGAALITK